MESIVIQGDSLEVLKQVADNSFDSCVTDPPYGLSFMGKKWDYDVPSVELWREVYRVLKPGAHLLSFGGTRTYHRMVVAIEDAGFEIRDQIMWIYGSGFPKSHNISKAIDKLHGTERKVIGISPPARPNHQKGNSGHQRLHNNDNEHSTAILTAPATPDAIKWDGWGSALKPANEPIVLARKPLEKGLSIAENVLKWGCGALNIDRCRVEAVDQEALAKYWNREQSKTMEDDRATYGKFGAIDLRDRAPQGRWPANVIFDEAAAEVLDKQSGTLKSGGFAEGQIVQARTNLAKGFEKARAKSASEPSSGGASRFFYCAKASKSERNRGCEGTNMHPTVKPVKLMEYLIKLVTPPNGIVLDPFMGSGTTGVAAKLTSFNCIGIELSPEYVAIAEKRIAGAVPGNSEPKEEKIAS